MFGSANPPPLPPSSPFFLQIQFVILNSETLEIIFEGRDSRQYISEMKFSGDGHTLAIGSRDTKIYLYDTKNFGLRAKCEKHNSYITHFDFAMDSNFLQSNCGAFELLFCELLDFSSHFLRVLAL
jgi:hypothetical protein